MTLGERCDEIVRLIDETLVSVGASTPTGSGSVTEPAPAPARGVTGDGHRRRRHRSVARLRTLHDDGTADVCPS